MRSRKGGTPPDDERWAQMTARIGDLEDRVRLLEARLRTVSAAYRVEVAAEEARKKTRAARTRPRPRCPGCTLELPKGRRGDYCVWCGFMFSAVGGRARR